MEKAKQPYLVERNPGYFEYQLPISVKMVIDIKGKVPLLRNERDEWELPGGKLELGETPESTVLREVQEELTLEPELLSGVDIVDSWVYEIFPHRHVFIVSYGAEYTGSREPKLSNEHKELGLFDYEDVPGLVMPEPYKKTIAQWQARQQRP
ncbi:NUDIX domain-containing protein [Streptomyces sp. NPDC021562]|uniref:NUDIX domain-containing protein n=1 Tax=Streptomyces sp. NPDC021562 TaxID=3155121 RepID=UPI00104F28FD